MSIEEQYKRLRKYLNPSVRGPNTDAVLYAMATGAAHLVNNVEAVHDQVYIASAVDRYLDQRLADYGLDRPTQVGLSDDVYRSIGISVINRKQVRDLITKILSTIFGDELTQATSRAAELEPYALSDQDQLLIKFDGGEIVTVTFETGQFANIAAATAQEVADAITKSIRAQGRTGRAFVKDDGLGPYVVLISDTEGPSSSVAVYGGRAQNELLFDKSRPTTAGMSTQWTVSVEPGGKMRYTWSGGANPSVGKIRVGDYVNIYSTGFDQANRGTYVITDFRGGLVNSAYFEIENVYGVPEIVSQGSDDGVLFFQPIRYTINSKIRYAAVFQEQASLLEIFIPATTKVVRRDRIGSAHIHGEANIVTETFNPGLNQVSDISCPAPGSISDGQYFLISSANDITEYYVYFDTTGGNLADPAPMGKTPIRVDISTAATSGDVAAALETAINGGSDFSARQSSSTVRLCNLAVGVSTPPANVDVGGSFAIASVQTGADSSTTTTTTPNPDEAFPANYGPYVYDLSQPFSLSNIGSTLTAEANSDSGSLLSTVDSSGFPDSQGNVVLGYGTSHQEGPIPYIARPSSGSILLSPAYKMMNTHPVGTDVALVAQTGPVVLAKDGSDYQFYITDVIAGRLYTEQLIRDVAATGINLLITVLYPSDEGLGKWGTENSEKTWIWGE